VLVDGKEQSDTRRVIKIVIAHGPLSRSTQQRRECTCTIGNRDSMARTLVIEHPARAGWKLSDGEAPAVSSASRSIP
jgi:hypothetical protein